MSIDLARTLHDTVDGAGTPGLGEGVGTDLDALVGRVRRRRTRRAVTRGVAGVGAAGAVALAGTQVVGRRGPDGVLPAADPSAAPGACGSQIADVPQSADAVATLGRAALGQETLGDVGTYGDDASADPLAVAGRVLVATLSVSSRTIGQTGVDRFHIDSNLASHTVYAVAHDGLVVGLQPAVTSSSSTEPISWGYWVDEDGHTSGFAAATSLAFGTCGPAASGGGVTLPDGPYELYAIDAGTTGDDGAPAAILGGPWALDLQPALPTVTALPDGFPTDEVPVLGESVYDVFELDGVAASGWVLQTRTSAVNSVEAATQTLVDAGGEPWGLTILEGGNGVMGVDASTRTVQTEHWTVTLSMRTAKDGTSLLRYRLEPR